MQAEAAIVVPDEAVWLGLEWLADAPSDAWERLDVQELGGMWWRVGAVDPLELAKRADAGRGLLWRVVWAPEDRRVRKLGASIPFQVEAPAPAPTPPPRADAPPVAPQPQRAHTGQVQPSIPMAFTPPAAGGAELTNFVYIHQLIQQDKHAWQVMVLQMFDTMLTNERNRSREAIEAMRIHYEAINQSHQQTQTAMIAAQKGGEGTAIQLQQLLATQTQAIGLLAQKIDELEAEDPEAQAAALMKLSENPNNLERTLAGIQSIVATVANSPLADPIARALGAQPRPMPPHPHHEAAE